MKKYLAAACVLLMPLLAFGQNNHKGTVLTTFNAGTYTYMEIDENGKKVWLAAPELEVKTGDTVETSYGTLMPDFYSSSLKKTFAEIFFVTFATNLSKREEKAKPPTAAKVTLADIKKPGGAKSLKEIFDGKDKLNNKTIVLVGQVTKASQGIMGKNWFHVTDNSGKDKPLDLTVTSADTAAVGDIIRIEGVLTVDKNIGAGYFFPIIIEDAKITPFKQE